MVPKPISDWRKVPMSDVASSGADPPAAINVAPATSILKFIRLGPDNSSKAGTKNSSQMIASARNMYRIPMIYKSVNHQGLSKSSHRIAGSTVSPCCSSRNLICWSSLPDNDVNNDDNDNDNDNDDRGQQRNNSIVTTTVLSRSPIREEGGGREEERHRVLYYVHRVLYYFHHCVKNPSLVSDSSHNWSIVIIDYRTGCGVVTMVLVWVLMIGKMWVGLESRYLAAIPSGLHLWFQQAVLNVCLLLLLLHVLQYYYSSISIPIHHGHMEVQVQA